MKVSLFVPITRWWALNQLFHGLNGLETNEHFQIHERIFYIDTDDMRTINGVKEYADEHDQIIVSGNSAPTEVRITERRNRITAMKNASRQYIDGHSDYVISVEDDTILPPDAAIKLTDMARKNPNIGIGSGVQVGRWKARMIGLWRVDSIEQPTRFITLPHTPYDYIEEIDAAGMYCYITATPLYKDTDYRWQEPLGPDVFYGLDLRRQSYTNYVDWSLVCGHSDYGKVLYPDGDCCQILYEQNGNRWDMKISGKKALQLNHGEAKN